MPMTFQIPESAFAPFYDTPVAFFGTRTGARTVAFTANCMVSHAAAAADGESYAPTRERIYTISVPKSAWKDATPPQIGDWMRIVGEERVVQQSAEYDENEGDYVITASWKPDRRPAW